MLTELRELIAHASATAEGIVSTDNPTTQEVPMSTPATPISSTQVEGILAKLPMLLQVAYVATLEVCEEAKDRGYNPIQPYKRFVLPRVKERLQQVALTGALQVPQDLDYWAVLTELQSNGLIRMFQGGKNRSYLVIPSVYDKPFVSKAAAKAAKPLPTAYQRFTGSATPRLTQTIGQSHEGVTSDNILVPKVAAEPDSRQLADLNKALKAAKPRVKPSRATALQTELTKLGVTLTPEQLAALQG